jgi:hypothetical protein
MTMLAVILLLAALQEPQPPSQEPQPQEPKPIPKGSVEILTTGCLKGKAFSAMGPREDGLRRGPDVRGRTFRLNGPKDLMKEVKNNDGHLVEIDGIVRQNDLAEPLGGKLGGMRVGIGAPNNGGSPVASPMNGPMTNVVIMDVSMIRSLADSCRVPGHE